MPKVSVIVPCYNHGLYIDEAINSVLEQTFQDFEIIIVNDGSTDKLTNTLLTNYQKPKTKVLCTTNQGLAAARNNGIKLATGEFILPLDADDMIKPTYLESTIGEMNDRNVGIVTTEKVTFFGLFNKVWGEAKPGGVELFTKGKNAMVATSLYRKKVWEDIGGYDEQMKQGYEDWDFWLRATAKDWLVATVQEPLFCYRKHEESMLSKSEKVKPEVMRYMVEKNIAIYRENIVDAIYSREEEILKQKELIGLLRKKEAEYNSFLQSRSMKYYFFIGKLIKKTFGWMKAL